MSPTPAAAGDALGGSGFLVDLHGRPGGTTLNTHTSKERGAHPNRGDSYLQNIREADKGNKNRARCKDAHSTADLFPKLSFPK